MRKTLIDLLQLAFKTSKKQQESQDVFCDITEHKESEKTALQNFEQEHQHRIEQTQFMAMLAHELKTPLSVIRMTMDSKSTSPELLSHARQAVIDINNIIDRCLLSEKLADDQIQATRYDYSLNYILNNILSGFCQNSNMSERFIIHVETSFNIQTDEQLLNTILMNLIDNAVKYSPPKSPIQIHIGTDTNTNSIAIAIQNLVGKASYPDEEKVFQKYYRHKAAHHKTGSGLGLYLVKAMSNLLGGDIFYTHDQTSITFKLCLPI